MKHVINARRFSNVPTFFQWDTAHRFPAFEIVEEVKIEIDAPDLDSAYLWLLKNLPAYAIGCGINNEKGDFMFAPVKDYYYFIPDYDDSKIVAYEIEQINKRG
jgi:hypothetical protein